MDMHIVVKKTTGRVWYCADSARFHHTNAPQFQSTVDTLNKVNDGVLMFDIMEYRTDRKAMPSYIANIMRYTTTEDIEDPAFEIEHDGEV